jgi:pyrrolidone-carboxylate peptidase
MYVALHLTGGSLPAGFIHLPSLPDEVASQRAPQPSMPLETQIEGVRIAIGAVVRSLVA